MASVQIPIGTRVWQKTSDGFWIPATMGETGVLEQIEFVEGIFFQGVYGSYRIPLRVEVIRAKEIQS